MPDTNPLLEMVRALELIRDRDVKRRLCMRCGCLPGDKGDLHDAEYDCGIASKALAAFKAWRPADGDELVEAACATYLGPSYKVTQRDRQLMRAALKALWEHLGLTEKETT